MDRAVRRIPSAAQLGHMASICLSEYFAERIAEFVWPLVCRNAEHDLLIRRRQDFVSGWETG